MDPHTITKKLNYENLYYVIRTYIFLVNFTKKSQFFVNVIIETFYIRIIHFIGKKVKLRGRLHSI